MFCFGHRGAAGHEPENTLRSIRKALELGAHGIEVDVHFTDGHLVVIHDDTLQRTTNGRGPVAKKTFAELRTLDAGHGERIPTPAEVFDAVARRALINVELKGPRTAAPVVALIDEYVRQRGWHYEDFLLSSFDHEQVCQAKHLRPEIRTAPLINKIPPGLAEFAEQMGAWAVNVSRRCVTQALVDDAHARGLKVFVYTINESRDIAKMKSLGVDGVFSDFPERAII
ncbi:MAG TPA: glycerophosphodiester phosphodiesterase family protein [Verrucomicrobiota bacterium]|nr:glycerophosphodiester phosphodiesterase family protein [Verrucomicrobiota bacterium]